MKKLALLLLLAVCVTCLTCGSAEGTLPNFANLTGLDDFLAGINEENPIESMYFSHRYGFSTAEFSTADPDKIDRVVSALKKQEIIGISNMDITDWYPYMRLSAADGTVLVMMFNGEWLEQDMVHYELSGVKELYKELNKLIDETTESRRTVLLNGNPVDLLWITLNDFYNAGFKAEFDMELKQAYVTHPDYNGGMVVGITDESPEAPITFISMAFADDLPVAWCGGTPYSGLDYWEKELDGLLFDIPDSFEGYEPELGWKCAEFYYGSEGLLRFMSKGDAPELHIIRE